MPSSQGTCARMEETVSNHAPARIMARRAASPVGSSFFEVVEGDVFIVVEIV